LLPARLTTTTATAATTSGPASTTTPAAAGTSTAPAPAAAKASTATTTGAEAALGLGTGFVDVQGTAVQTVTVKGGDSLIRLAFVFHFHEREPARTAGFAICHYPGAVNLAIPFEEAADRLFTGIKIQVAYENILHSFLLSL
jgi:hypothetical protein